MYIHIYIYDITRMWSSQNIIDVKHILMNVFPCRSVIM